MQGPTNSIARWLVGGAAILAALVLVLWWGALPKGSEEPRASSGPASIPKNLETGVGGGPATRVAAEARREKTNESPARRAGSKSLVGRVVDPAGAPVAGALVVARSFGEGSWAIVDLARARDLAGSLTAMSGADGRFALEAAGPGLRFGVTAWKVGFALSTEVVAEAEIECVVRLVAGREILGVVREAGSGVPIARATIAWSGIVGGVAQRLEARSDAEGNYRLLGVPTRHQIATAFEGADVWLLRCDAAGHAFAFLDAKSVPAQADPNQLRIDLDLEPAIPVVVHVVDGSTGAPVRDARVWLRIYSNVSHHHDRWHRLVENPLRSQVLEEKRTGANGDVQFDNVPTGVRVEMGTLRFSAIPPDLAPAAGHLGPEKNKNPREVTIRCFPPCTLEGRVVDTESRPVAGASVRVWAVDSSAHLFGSNANIVDGKDPWAASTNADGTYRLERVPVAGGTPSTVTVHAESPQKLNALQGIAADANVDVVARQTIHVKDLVLPSEIPAAIVIVADSNGNPVAGAHVSADGAWIEAFTDATGRARVSYRSGGEAQPPARLRVRAPGFASTHTQQFIASAKEPPELRVTLEREKTIAGKVVLEGDTPAPFARVVASSARTTTKRVNDGATVSDEMGEFTISGLEGETFDVEVQWNPNALPATQGGDLRTTIRDIAADTNDLRIELRKERVEPAIAKLTGRVLDAGTREAMTQANVVLTIDGKTRFARGKGDGSFEIPVAKFGTHRLSASAWKDRRAYTFEDPGFVVDATTAAKPLEILVKKAPLVRGTVEVVGASAGSKKGRISFYDVDGRDVGMAEFGVTSNFAYTLLAPRPGTYRPVVHLDNETEIRMGWVAERGAALVIPNDTDDRTFDVTIVRAGLLAITFDDASLGSTVEVAPEGGAVVTRLVAVRKRFDGEALLPAGRYVVTAKGSDGVERRATADLQSGRSTLCVLK